MFFLPYNTDAPIYHFPLVTITMIVINVVAFVLTVMYPEAAIAYCLDHGNGLHPIQWITSSFMHAGIIHLVGNMLALWTFGLIVEGKIGWWRMAVIYLGIGIVQNMIEQVFMLWAVPGISLGASAIVYGLMAMSMLWAPKNNVDCIFIFFLIIYHFEVAVMSLVGFMLAMAFTVSILSGLAMSSALLHSMGALLGGAVGYWMLKTDRVDCENWDLFSVSSGKNMMTDDELRALAEQDPAYQEEKRKKELEVRKTTMARIRALVAEGNPQEAFTLYRRTAPKLDNWRLPEADLRKMIVTFHKQSQWSASIPAMVELLQSSPEDTSSVRLKLAQILVQTEHRPAQAWNVFSKIDPSQLDTKQLGFHAKLKRVIQKAREENPYDVVDADW